MILWYVGGSVLAVLLIFRSSGIDYRLIALGSLLPLAVDLYARRLWFGHTLAFTVGVLAVVMLGTIGRSRLLRRRLLCVPIGMFFGLILSGVWRFTEILWWPTLGLEFPDHRLLGPWWIVAIKEVIGLIACWSAVGLTDLYEPDPRAEFFRAGHLRMPQTKKL